MFTKGLPEPDRIMEFDKIFKDNTLVTEKFEDWLIQNGFFTAPASTKYHGAYEGGLFDHSVNVTNRLVQLTIDNKLQWQRPESPYIVGMFHDLCKIDQYNKVYDFEDHYHYEYNTNTILKGHGTKSIILLSQFISLTEEEILCIRFHMGPYGNEQEQKDEWAAFDKAIKRYETTYWSHSADMLASKRDEKE